MPTQANPTADPFAAIATPVQAAQSSTADPFASIATPIPGASAQSTDTSAPQVSVAHKIANAVGSASEFAAGVIPGAVQEMGKTVQALPWVGKKIISPDAMTAERAYFAPGSAAESYGNTAGHIAEPLLEFVLGDEALKGVALADRIGLAGKIAKIAQDSPYIGKILQHGVNAARMGTVGTTEALAKGATLPEAVATGAATGVGGEALSAAADAGVSRLIVNPFRRIVKGAEIAQPAARGALTDAAAAAAKNSGVVATPTTGGFRTALDDTISKTAKIERAQYDRINVAAGTDLKSLYDREGELQDALDDPANIVAKPSLQTELERTRMQIANGESKASESGIDAQKSVRQAKDLTQQRYALQEVKKKLFNNESVIEGNIAHGADESVKTDSAIRAVENLDKPSRYAPEGSDSRLAQALGTDGAKALKDNLYAAQKAGQQAISARKVAAWVGGLLGAGSGLVEGYKVVTGN